MTTESAAPAHEGQFVGRDGKWRLWQCAEDCPHPDHEVNEPLRRAAERAATTITRRPA